MKTFLVVMIVIVAIAIVLFCSWFLTMKAYGKCPLCALKKITKPTKITMDIDTEAEKNIALTPPMGWSSWNTFRNHIDQDLIMEVAHAMKNSGLADAGYKYVNLDDCWQSSERDSEGKLQGDLRTFNRGIPQLIKDINALGLKVGLYSSNGTLTCEDMPASLGNEELDAKTLASWGCEFFKYDFCHKKRISGDCPAVELIEINKIGTSQFSVLKPKDAELSGRAKVIDIKELPTGKAIGYLGYGAGTATFKTRVFENGDYALTVVYQKTFKRHNQYMQIIINGRMYEMTFPTGNGFSDNGRQQIVVELSAGENIITIKNPVVTLADSSYLQYKKMGDELKKATALWAKFTGTAEKPIVFSICEWGTAKPWLWGNYAGNMWRTTHDIFPMWKSIRIIYERTIRLYKYSGVGGWNDPDMLEVGNGKLTENENKAHFSLWCMMAAPLMLGNDVRKFVDGNGNAVEGNAALRIVTNKQLIAIDQDSLGRSAKVIKRISGVDVLARPLSNGDVALCFFNKTSGGKNIRFDLNTLADDKYLEFRKSSEYELHDLWSDERTRETGINVALDKHSVKVLRVKNI